MQPQETPKIGRRLIYYTRNPRLSGKIHTFCRYINFDPTIHAKAHWQMITVSDSRLADEAEPYEELAAAPVIYPNPVANQLNISLPASGSQSLARLYHSCGQLVISTTIVDAETSLEVRHLAKGIYILELTNGLELTKTKIIKQ